MGIIKKGILGGFSGKVGNVVGASWKGIDYLRSLPSQVANPRTEGQMIVRTKLSLVVKFLRSCITLVRIGFKGFAVKMSAFNAAASYNLQQAFTGMYPDLELDYANLMVCRGNLAAADNALVSSLVPGTIEFTWNYDPVAVNAGSQDSALLLVHNPLKGDSVYTASSAIREDEAASIDVPEDWSGDTVECFIAFADLTKMTGTQPKDYTSNSIHAGTLSLN